jgi:hypothetical protein
MPGTMPRSQVAFNLVTVFLLLVIALAFILMPRQNYIFAKDHPEFARFSDLRMNAMESFLASLGAVSRM